MSIVRYVMNGMVLNIYLTPPLLQEKDTILAACYEAGLILNQISLQREMNSLLALFFPYALYLQGFHINHLP